MKQKKWLFRTASGVVAAIMLALPAYAAESGITITDNASSGGVYQLRLGRCYLFSWLMALAGFAEALCLVETGSRSRDGNFLWGYLFAVFWLYVMSLMKWLSLRNVDIMLLSPEGSPWGRLRLILVRAAYVLAGLVLLYQLWCGTYFFIRLLGGETYFMMR